MHHFRESDRRVNISQSPMIDCLTVSLLQRDSYQFYNDRPALRRGWHVRMRDSSFVKSSKLKRSHSGYLMVGLGETRGRLLWSANKAEALTWRDRTRCFS
jgi:hypothetical protein